MKQQKKPRQAIIQSSFFLEAGFLAGVLFDAGLVLDAEDGARARDLEVGAALALAEGFLASPMDAFLAGTFFAVDAFLFAAGFLATLVFLVTAVTFFGTVFFVDDVDTAFFVVVEDLTAVERLDFPTGALDLEAVRATGAFFTIEFLDADDLAAG